MKIILFGYVIGATAEQGCAAVAVMQLYQSVLYREAESYVSLHPTGKHQCTRLGSVPNLNSQASSFISEG